MKVYEIIDISGHQYEDYKDWWESVRGIAYISKEKAYKAILAQITNGEFKNGYDESIVVDKLPTIDELSDDFGWIVSEGPEYNGLRIQEIVVIEEEA